jgi:hypothetical protein
MDKPQADQTETIKQLQAEATLKDLQLLAADGRADREKERADRETERADRLNESHQQSLREKLVLEERCERQAQVIVQRDTRIEALEANERKYQATIADLLSRNARSEAKNKRLTAANTEKNWIIGVTAASVAVTALSKNSSRRRY